MTRKIINYAGALALTFLLLTFAFKPACSQNILLWQNYAQATMVSPETGQEITPDFDLKLALAGNMRYFDVVNDLPDDLSTYDIIFITLGFAMDCG